MKYTLIILTLLGGIYYGTNYRHAVRANTVPEPQREETPTTGEILAYIAYVFGREGKGEVIKAINCFYSESGLRPDAVNINHHKDGTVSRDRGLAQINDKFHPDLTDEKAFSYKDNIVKAYKIYKSRGNNFSAWYGKGCKE